MRESPWRNGTGSRAGGLEHAPDYHAADLVARLGYGHELLARVLRELLRADADALDAAIHNALARLGAFCRVDRAYLFRVRDGNRIDNTHEWCAPGIEPMIEHLQDVPIGVIGAWLEPFEADEAVDIPDVSALPDDRPEKETLKFQGIRALVAVPLMSESGLAGFLGFDAVEARPPFSAGEIALLRSTAEAIAIGLSHADARRRAREARERLTRINARLAAILDALPELVLEVDRSGRCRMVSGGAQGLFPFDLSGAPGQAAEEFLPAELASLLRTMIADHGLGRSRLVRDCRIEVPSGHRWIEVSMGRIAAGGAEDEQFVFVMRDSTKMRKAQENLRRLGQVVEAMTNLVTIVDPEGRITWVNNAFERHTGYRLEEIEGCGFAELVRGPESDPEVARAVEIAVERRASFEGENVNYRRNGEPYWIRFNVHPLFGPDGSYLGHVSVETVITEQKMLEMELGRERGFLEAVLRTSVSAITALDGDGRIVFANEEARRILGLSADPARGRGFDAPTWRIETLSGEPMPKDDLPFERVKRTGQSQRDIRHAICLPDGSRRILSVNAAPIEGSPSGAEVVCAVTDITAEMAAAERLSRQSRLEAVGALTGGIAHDFNNLLTIIAGASDLLERRARHDSAMMRIVSMNRDAAERGRDLVARMLAFARRQELDPVPTDVNALLVGMRQLIDHAVGESIEVEEDLAPDIWPALIDPGKLESAILNLCINARDAMLPQGGQIVVATRNISLTGDAGGDEEVRSGDYVEISVTDTGCGMAPEVKARAVEPFFTTKHDGRGNGLGLSMVYGFARQSGGHLQLLSEVGRGTTVRIFLPRVVADVEAPCPADDEATARGGAERILVVEDDPRVREHVCLMLETLGYRPLVAGNAREALSVLRREVVDLVFTDVVMPGNMSGFDLAEEIGRLGIRLPVIFTSSYADDVDPSTRQGARGGAMLQKPYTLDALDRRIRQTLARRPIP